MRMYLTHSDRIVPMHHPRVLVEIAVLQGADRNAVLQDSGVTAEMLTSPFARISYDQWSVLTTNALRLTGNTALGLDVGRGLQISAMGILALRLMTSITAGDALRAALRFYRAFAPIWDMTLTVDAGRAFLQIREAIPLKRHRAFAFEALLASIDAQASFLLGMKFAIRRLRLSYPRPAYAERYAELCDAPVLFDQDVVEIEFDAAMLDLPVIFRDPVTRDLAEQMCEEQTPRLIGHDVGAKVRDVLASACERPPCVADVARNLRMSERSLRRALRRTGTSYHELVDQTRRTRAEEWIRSTPLTLREISDRLGFSNVRSFRRAFIRWTGAKPSALAAAVRGRAYDEH